jgi:hypothetical protein
LNHLPINPFILPIQIADFFHGAYQPGSPFFARWQSAGEAELVDTVVWCHRIESAVKDGIRRPNSSNNRPPTWAVLNAEETAEFAALCEEGKADTMHQKAVLAIYQAGIIFPFMSIFLFSKLGTYSARNHRFFTQTPPRGSGTGPRRRRGSGYTAQRPPVLVSCFGSGFRSKYSSYSLLQPLIFLWPLLDADASMQKALLVLGTLNAIPGLATVDTCCALNLVGILWTLDAGPARKRSSCCVESARLLQRPFVVPF